MSVAAPLLVHCRFGTASSGKATSASTTYCRRPVIVGAPPLASAGVH